MGWCCFIRLLSRTRASNSLSVRMYSNQSTFDTIRRTLASWFLSEPKYWLTRFLRALAFPIYIISPELSCMIYTPGVRGSCMAFWRSSLRFCSLSSMLSPPKT